MNIKILKGSVIVICLTGFSKIMGFAREILIAAIYGVGYESDVLIYVISMDTILFLSIANALPTAIVPFVIECKTKKNNTRLFLCQVASVITCFAIFICIVGVCFPQVVLSIFAPGLIEHYGDLHYNELLRVTKIILVSNIFVGITYTIVGYLQAVKKFTKAAMANIVYNFAIIVIMLLIGMKADISIMVLGFTVAYFIQMIYAILVLLKKRINTTAIVNRGNYIKPFLILLLPIILSASVQQINYLVDKRLVSLAGSGSISILHYGYKASTIIYSILATSVVTVMYTYISRDLQSFEKEKSYQYIYKGIIQLLKILLPVFAFSAILSREIIYILFEHGKFRSENADMVSRIMLLYTPGMIFWSIRDYLLRVFYAIKESKIPLINTIICVSLNIYLDYILFRYMGMNGVALATSISAGVSCIILGVTIFIYVRCKPYLFWIDMFKVVGSSSLMCIAIFILKEYCLKNVNTWARLLVLCIVFLFMYATQFIRELIIILSGKHSIKKGEH